MLADQVLPGKYRILCSCFREQESDGLLMEVTLSGDQSMSYNILPDGTIRENI